MSDEFDAIRRHFRSLTPPGSDVVRGIGDDCAVLRPPPGHDLAVSIDTLVDGVHFPGNTAPADIGWKSLACGLSDLAAAGAEPAWCLLALTHPDGDDEWFAAFADGFGALARAHDIALVGGDLTRGPLSVTVQVAGYVPTGTQLGRAGARAGDSVFVSGYPGRAAAGLRQCLGQAATQDEDLRRALDRPEPRLALGRALREAGASACVDVSDGLAADLGHILDASGVGAVLDLSGPSRDPALCAAGTSDEVRDWILHGGDDYELCFTLAADADPRQLAEAGGVEVTRIGRITDKQGLMIKDASGTRRIGARGYSHFGDPGAADA